MSRFPRCFPTNRAFTLTEVLVAMVVLALGLLGMAAMTVLAMRGNRGASDLTTVTNLCQAKVEALKDVPWADLGGEDSSTSAEADQKQFGLLDGDIYQETGLNSEGKDEGEVEGEIELQNPSWDDDQVDEAVRERGPYRFTRSFVICRGDQYDASGNPPSGSEPSGSLGTPTYPAEFHCKVDPAQASTRTEEISCTEDDITTSPGPGNKEKKIKVLCTWSARDGRCRAVNFDTTVVDL